MPFAPPRAADPWTLPAALAVMLGSAALLGGALLFQHIGGLAPCALCLPQRGPHAAAIVLAAWAAVCARSAPEAARLLLACAALVLLLSLGLGLHHAGIEAHWWKGPASCTGAPGAFPGSAADLGGLLKTAHIVRCDAVAWSWLGLSLAGYNALLSGVLALAAAAPPILALKGRPR